MGVHRGRAAASSAPRSRSDDSARPLSSSSHKRPSTQSIVCLPYEKQSPLGRQSFSSSSSESNHACSDPVGIAASRLSKRGEPAIPKSSTRAWTRNPANAVGMVSSIASPWMPSWEDGGALARTRVMSMLDPLRSAACSASMSLACQSLSRGLNAIRHAPSSLMRSLAVLGVRIRDGGVSFVSAQRFVPRYETNRSEWRGGEARHSALLTR